ncbi:C39 family peptidase [Desulfosporosinus fructosivorans]
MKKIKRFLVVLLTSTLFFLSTTILYASNGPQQISIDKDIALKTAEKFMANTNMFNSNVQVKFKSNMYDTSDNLIGYYCNLISEGKNAGYVLVSASRDLPPILEYGEGNIPYEVDKNIDNGKKFYYLSGLQYEFANNASELKDEFEAKRNQALNELEESGFKNTEQYTKLEKAKLKKLQKDSQKYQGSWDKLLSKDSESDSFRIMAYGTKDLSVQRIWQRTSGVSNPSSACGPTTGAMIANYYKNQGYDIRGTSYYGNDAVFINHLYSEMGSSITGTSAVRWRNGIMTHLNHNYSIQEWLASDIRANGNWSYYCQSIDSNRPVALRFDFFSSNGAYSSYHFVCGQGYQDWGDTDLYAGIKDPDGGQYNTSTTWINWGINAPDLAMIRTTYLNQ